jgi:membrane protease YdiL (CAAX protease family)
MAISDVSEIAKLLGNNLFLFLMLVSFAVGLVGVIFSAKVLHKQSFIHLTTARSKIDWSRFWFIFVIWGIFSAGSTYLSYYFAPEDYIFNFNLKPFLILCALVIFLLPLQTSFEEYFLRGYLMQGLGVMTKENSFAFSFLYILIGALLYSIAARFIHFDFFKILLYIVVIIGLYFIIIYNVLFQSIVGSHVYKSISNILSRKSTPLFITSLIFGVLHGSNPEVDKLGPVMMIFYIGTGLVLGIMTLMDDGLELALGFHAANNMFTAVLVTSDWSALQTDALLTYTADPEKMALAEIAGPVFIVYPILLYILSKKYGWTNWKEKLFGPVTVPPQEDYKILEHDTRI